LIEPKEDMEQIYARASSPECYSAGVQADFD
jgi:hypothetical protein